LERVLGKSAGAEKAKPVSSPILLTSLMHVNRPEARFSPQRIQFDVVGVLRGSISAAKLTVPHKTVAEPR
jgi:hypothetical protein